jgi:peptide chain release factor subunit 1
LRSNPKSSENETKGVPVTQEDQLGIMECLDRLAAFEPTELPVISLYLNTQPDQHGRANFEAFVRKEFRARSRTFARRSLQRESFDRDAQRIREYLTRELRPDANGVAVFACAGKNDFLEALQLEAPVNRHQLFIGSQPHLYVLARLADQYRRYAAVIADTNSARIFVIGLNKILGADEVRNVKTNRTQRGGWAQARYQRHVDNYHLQHAKEVVDALDRIVRDEDIERIVFGGDEVIIPLLQEQLPPHLAAKVVDALRLDITTPEHEILRATLEAMKEQDAGDDAQRVERLLSEYRAGGLATAGLRDTLKALQIGQVDELILTASASEIGDDSDQGEEEEPIGPFTTDELVTHARRTGARVRFIEDPALLAGIGGVGAMLRYRI